MHPQSMPTRKSTPMQAIGPEKGLKFQLLWDDDQKWYNVTIVEHDQASRVTQVKYSDGAVETVQLDELLCRTVRTRNAISWILDPESIAAAAKEKEKERAAILKAQEEKVVIGLADIVDVKKIGLSDGNSGGLSGSFWKLTNDLSRRRSKPQLFQPPSLVAKEAGKKSSRTISNREDVQRSERTSKTKPLSAARRKEKTPAESNAGLVKKGKRKSLEHALTVLVPEDAAGSGSVTKRKRIGTNGNEDVKSYCCTYEDCDKSFTRKNNLTVHERTHTGEKPFVCRDCEKSFSVKGNLRTHILTHKGEKRFVCSICNQRFSRNANLLDHVKGHQKKTKTKANNQSGSKSASKKALVVDNLNGRPVSRTNGSARGKIKSGIKSAIDLLAEAAAAKKAIETETSKQTVKVETQKKAPKLVKAIKKSSTRCHREINVSDVVWVKYSIYSECYWPGRVVELVDDDIEKLVAMQQAFERLPRRSEADLKEEPVLSIEWFNHFTKSEDDDVVATTNDFLACELQHFASSFRELWRKRSHVRVGDQAHCGEPYDRAVFDAVCAWRQSMGFKNLSATDLSVVLRVEDQLPQLESCLALAASDKGKADTAHEDKIAQRWSCGRCSLLNDVSTSACEACGHQCNVPGHNSSRDGRANVRRARKTVLNDDNFASVSSAANGKHRSISQFEPTGFLGQGMSGSLTKGSVSQVLLKLGLRKGDKFVDLGSGVGNVTLQAAVEFPYLDWSMGIEHIEEAWTEAMVRHESMKQSSSHISKVIFHRKDLMEYEAEDLPNASHAYIFAAGMPPELQLHLCRVLCKAPTLIGIAVVIDGQTGRGKTSLSTLLTKSSCFKYASKLSGVMRGSGSGKTVIIFERT